MEDSTCVICAQTADLLAVGQCDHPVCLRCSARMRKLKKTNQCPVCREDLLEVLIMKERRPFASFRDIKSLPGDRDLGMRFENRTMRTVLTKLFESRCKLCADREPEPTFARLKTHMRSVHQMFNCEICEEHLMLYPEEIPFFSRADLARHRRPRDEDTTGSNPGHPECEFCHERYLDQDALYIHLRQDHFWCHICESRRIQAYFDDYAAVRQHFASAHFLCTEGNCVNEKFTSVFANRLDEQAHRAREHSTAMSRSEVRQLRQVDVGDYFSFPALGNAAGADAADTGRGGHGNRPGHRRYPETAAPSHRARGYQQRDDDLALGLAMSASAQADAANTAAPTRHQGKSKSAKSKGPSRSAASRPLATKPSSDHTPAATASHGVSSEGAGSAVAARERRSSPPLRPADASAPRRPSPVTASYGETSAAASSSSLSSGAAVAPAAVAVAGAGSDFPSLAESASLPSSKADSSTNGYASKLVNAVARTEAPAHKPAKGPPPGLGGGLKNEFPPLSSSSPSTSTSTSSSKPKSKNTALEDFPSLSSGLPPQQTRPVSAAAAPPPGFASAVGQRPAIDTGMSPAEVSLAAAAPEWRHVKKPKKKGAPSTTQPPSTTTTSTVSITNNNTNRSAAAASAKPPPSGLHAPKTANGPVPVVEAKKSSNKNGVNATPASSEPEWDNPRQRKQSPPAAAMPSPATSSKKAKKKKSAAAVETKVEDVWDPSLPAVPRPSAPSAMTSSSLVSQSSVEQFKKAVKLALNYNEESYKSFTLACGLFHSENMTAAEFYNIIETLFGANLPELFNALLDQLQPDKRSAVLQARNDAKIMRAAGGKAGRAANGARKVRVAPSAWDQAATASGPAVLPCSNAMNTISDFPSLGGAAASSSTASTGKPKGYSSSEDFPALSSRKVVTNVPAWGPRV